jgi:hypothetical protein
MADDFARLQRQRAQAEAAGDRAAVARFDARIQAASAGPAADDPAAAVSGPVPPSEAAQAEQASRDAPLTDSSVGGVFKSLATGVRRFGEGIVAAPGNLITAEADLADKYLPQIGKRTWRQRIDEPSSGGPGVATSPEVTAAADDAVKAVLPQGGVDAVKDITQHEPQGLPEEIAQTAGEFAPALVSPGGPGKIVEGLLPKAAPAAVKAATKAATNLAAPVAATEGAGQATRAIAPEYEDAVRLVVGFASGAGSLKGGGKPNFMTRRALNKISGAGPEAAQAVVEKLVASGMTSEQAAARMKELGVDATPMDVNTSLRQEGQQAMVRGGEGRVILDDKLRDREVQANKRLQPDIRANVGPEVDRLGTLQVLKDRAAEVGGKYDAAHAAQTAPGDLGPLDSKIGTLMKETKDNELLGKLSQLRDKLRGEKPPAPAKQTFYPPKPQAAAQAAPLETGSGPMHEIRKAIDSMLYDHQGKPRDLGGNTGRVLKDLRKDLDTEIGNANPDVKALDEQFSQVKKEETAFKTGEELLDKDRSTLSPDEFQRTYDAMTPGEQTHIRKGMTREIDRLTGVNINDRVKLKNLIAGDDPASWNFGKIKTVIGEDGANKLMKALEREATFSETYQKVVQGSKTAESLPPRGNGKRTIGRAAVDAAPEVIASGVISPAAGASVAVSHLRSFIRERLAGSGTDGMSPEVNAQVARLLSSNRGDDLVELARLLQRGGNPTSGNVVRALQGRQEDVSTRKEHGL